MSNRLIPLLLGVALLVSSGADAGVDRWTPIGVVSAPIYYIAADPKVPTTLYANDRNHLFRSVDAGTTWRSTTDAPTPQRLTSSSCPFSYFIHPADGSIFARACYGQNGLFRSVDQGNSWQALVTPSSTFSVVGGAPNNGLVVYGLIDQLDAAKSLDGGATWTAIGGAWPVAGVTGILVDMAQSQVLYAWGPSGVFRSTDGGEHWASASTGLPASSVIKLVQVGSRLVLATASSGIYLSTDQAVTWSPGNIGLPDLHVVALAVSPGSVSPLYLVTGYGGPLTSYRSLDDGATWTPAGVWPAFDVRELVAGPPPYVFAATSTGVFVSSDRAASWGVLPVNAGLPRLSGSVLIDAGNPAVLYASTGYRSTNRGGDWTSVGLFQGFAPRPALTSPSQTGVVYAAFDGLMRSVDFGDTWVKLYSLPLFTHQYLQGIIEAPNGGRLVLTDGYSPFTPSTYDIPASHLLTSDDSGKTWVDASAGLPHAFLDAVTIDPADAATMYASVGNIVYKTIDGGRSWVNTSSVNAAIHIVYIAVQPKHPNIVYAATLPNFGVNGNAGGLYVSVDGGATWSLDQNLGHVPLNFLTFDPFTPTTIYAASNGQGVFRSTDAGQTWIAMSDGLNSVEALRVQNVAVDPVDSSNLYVGTDAGAYALTAVNPGRVASVIEYYAPQFDDYFITPVIDEIHVLDTQVIPGWYRTGYSFEAYVQPTPGADPLCRFYIPPASHFFSGFSPECAAVLEFNVPPFVLESQNSFYLPAPDMTTGLCPAGLLPVYRLYNNKPMLTNHRYTTDLAVKAQMVAKGYIAEGYGPDKVMMCAPN